jgi:hypothetical protein
MVGSAAHRVGRARATRRSPCSARRRPAPRRPARVPSPLAPATAQTADYWTYTGPASTAMWRLINEQAGPAAQASRRVPTLVMGDDPGVGASRLWSEQWAPVLTPHRVGGAVRRRPGGAGHPPPTGCAPTCTPPRRVRRGAVLRVADEPHRLGLRADPAVGDVRRRRRAGRPRRPGAPGDVVGQRRRPGVGPPDRAVHRPARRGRHDEAAADRGRRRSRRASARVARDHRAPTPSPRYGALELGDRVTVHVGLPGGQTARPSST